MSLQFYGSEPGQNYILKITLAFTSFFLILIHFAQRKKFSIEMRVQSRFHPIQTATTKPLQIKKNYLNAQGFLIEAYRFMIYP
jgi:hypothetical protein